MPTSDAASAVMGKDQQVMLGICGGVGPAAGLLLHQAILQHTENDGHDQGHLSVCHFSRSEDMTDRTAFLADPDALENPACGMVRTFEMMRAAAQSSKVRLVAGVPCNTFHARPIWSEFLRLTKAVESRDVVFVHMLDETVKFMEQHAPNCSRIGLMSTTGTRAARVYHDLLEPRGYTIVEVSDTLQAELHETIYHKKWGIKSTAPLVMPRCVANFHRYARLLRESGAEVIIMGCTEIPFAFMGKKTFAGALLIDPLVALARGMVREGDASRLKPLDLEGLLAPQALPSLAQAPCTLSFEANSRRPK
ncbi:TPA: hypothetical protein N0F65_001576 [Lagenidium giganteum]|uniref:Aspartate racemase n=1 Tax=Lagenidium giganteum TaxID=4803 RepID=A0AAV2Z6N5_9STRA|nr:TPA: hypothetical protein N0F65_001576 [Lagenidium giganteum]